MGSLAKNPIPTATHGIAFLSPCRPTKNRLMAHNENFDIATHPRRFSSSGNKFIVNKLDCDQGSKIEVFLISGTSRVFIGHNIML
jgi:hypothetical protein